MMTQNTFEHAEKLANAILCGACVVDPDSPLPVRQRQLGTRGSVLPQDYVGAPEGVDACYAQTECLVIGDRNTTMDVRVRFLHLVQRDIGTWSDDPTQDYCKVESLRVGDKVYQTWQEATARQFTYRQSTRPASAQQFVFSYPAQFMTQTLQESNGKTVGVVIRRQEAIAGIIRLGAKPIQDELFKVTVQIKNRTPMHTQVRTRAEALLRAFISTHAILRVRGGEFVSLINPPQDYRGAAAICQNIGTWPVLVGEQGNHDMMLSSPTILDDYPPMVLETKRDTYNATAIDGRLNRQFIARTDKENREWRHYEPT